MERERIRDKIIVLLTFPNCNNVNIATIHETKLTNKTKPLKTIGWAAVRLDRHKNKESGLLILIKDTNHISPTALSLCYSQPTLIWSNIEFRLRCTISTSCTFTTSKFHQVVVAALVTTSPSHTSSATMKYCLLLVIIM